MPAQLLDIADPGLTFPEFLVLDTNLILELASPSSHPNHQLAINFLNHLKRATRQGDVLPVMSRLTLEECYFKLCQRLLDQYSRLSGISWHQYYKQNPNAIRAVQPGLTQLYQLLLVFPVEIIEPEDLAIQPKGTVSSLAERMADFIYQFSLLPKDATILSEAERMGIFTIASLDSDLRRADGFTVITRI